MADKHAILAIDQGTTSSRAIVFDEGGRIVSVAQQEFGQIYPDDGWVEHDPEAIWTSTLKVSQEALETAEDSGYAVACIGITNQRETTLVWDRATGAPIYNAIVWQDRRTASLCKNLVGESLTGTVNSRTGLLLDPYFSATKVAWILDNVPGARARANAGELAFGTVDSFMIWRLTGGCVHATDATNASRTNLYNIHEHRWDDELLKLFDVPAAVLPRVLDCAADYGSTDPGLFGRPIPILGVAGDQQAAAIGQCCFEPGSIKSTYGTGCFVIVNTGDTAIASKNRLLTTIGYQIEGKATYALEGSIFVAGAAVQWLRDELGIIEHAHHTEAMARDLDSNAGVYLVPAFTGLGAPHWNPDARGALFGITRATGPREIVRATLESVCYQTHDLFSAMADDGVTPRSLKVDGGMVANDWLVGMLADILDLPVERPKIMETTALGAAYLAALQAGMRSDVSELTELWQLDGRFEPDMEKDYRQKLLRGWRQAVRRVVIDL